MDSDRLKLLFEAAFFDAEGCYIARPFEQLNLTIECSGRAIFSRRARYSYLSYRGDTRRRGVWEIIRRPFGKKRHIYGSERIELKFNYVRIPIVSADQHAHLSDALSKTTNIADLLLSVGFNEATSSLGDFDPDEYELIPGFDELVPEAVWLYDGETHGVDHYQDITASSLEQTAMWSEELVDNWISEIEHAAEIDLGEKYEWPRERLITWIQEKFPNSIKLADKNAFKYIYTHTYHDDQGTEFDYDTWGRIEEIDTPIYGYALSDGIGYEEYFTLRDLKISDNNLSFYVNDEAVNFDALKNAYSVISSIFDAH